MLNFKFNKMKKIKLICSAFLMMSVFSSCEDLLDKEPLDQISNEMYWKTAEDLRNYTIQFYTSFVPFANGINCYLGFDAEYGSDNALYGAEANTTLNGSRPIVENATANDAAINEWYWHKVRDVNIFFDNYKKCQDAPETWNQYLGEAYFFRAKFYFDLLRDYGDLPIYKSEIKMNSEDLYKPKDKRTDVVDFILDDLKHAETHLMTIKELSSKGGTNLLSKEATLLYMSRVALYEGTWQKYHAGTPFATEGADYTKYLRICVEATEKLMNNAEGKYTVGLYGKNAEDYGKMFGLDDMSINPEVLLWKGFDLSIPKGNDIQFYTVDRTNGRAATLQYVMSFLDKNGQVIDWENLLSTKTGNDFLTYLKDNADQRLGQTLWIPEDLRYKSNGAEFRFDKPWIDQTNEYLCSTGFQIKKGANPESPAAGSNGSINSETGIIIFRYAEVLLNYAEAKCELGETVDYDKSINLLRKRVGMPDFKIPESIDKHAVFYSDFGYEISPELYEIRRERRVELGQEGYRPDDYKRWRAHALFKNKRPLGYPFEKTEFPDFNTAKLLGDNCLETFNIVLPNLLDPFVNVIPKGYDFDEKRDYLKCIPTNEILLNPNLTQNPGWDN